MRTASNLKSLCIIGCVTSYGGRIKLFSVCARSVSVKQRLTFAWYVHLPYGRRTKDYTTASFVGPCPIVYKALPIWVERMEGERRKRDLSGLLKLGQDEKEIPQIIACVVFDWAPLNLILCLCFHRPGVCTCIPFTNCCDSPAVANRFPYWFHAGARRHEICVVGV